MLKSLRDLGYGKSASEDAVLHEAQLIIDNIKKVIYIFASDLMVWDCD